jgi:hypothetical protein
MGMKLITPVRVVVLSLVLALALAFAARVATGPGSAHAPAVTGTLVRAADFEHLDPDGPGSVVLRWWQANQFSRSLRDIQGFYAAPQRPSRVALRSDLKVMRYVFAETKPLVLDEFVTGDTADVFVLMPPLLKPPSDSAGAPYVFHLVREDGRWKLAGDFIADRARGERQFAAQEGRK